jgi:hypothetical protein
MYIPLVINGNVVRKLESDSFSFSSGLEFMSQRQLTFRLGISSKKNNYHTENFSTNFIAGISCGVGFQFKKSTLDIGFMNLGPAGYIIGFTISTKQN